MHLRVWFSIFLLLSLIEVTETNPAFAAAAAITAIVGLGKVIASGLSVFVGVAAFATTTGIFVWQILDQRALTREQIKSTELLSELDRNQSKLSSEQTYNLALAEFNAKNESHYMSKLLRVNIRRTQAYLVPLNNTELFDTDITGSMMYAS